MYAPAKRVRQCGGFTLTEIAIVLGIIGLVISAIWTASAQVSGNRKTQKEAANALQILNGYKNLYAAHGVDVADGTFVTCTGIMNGYFPADMILSGTSCASPTSVPSKSPQSPWGGNIWILAYQSTNMILISYGIGGPGSSDGLTQKACIGVASALTFSPDVVYENINASTNPNPFTATSTYTPYTISQITGLCNQSGTGNQVQIGFKAR